MTAVWDQVKTAFKDHPWLWVVLSVLSLAEAIMWMLTS
jgi:hypothetical protein